MKKKNSLILILVLMMATACQSVPRSQVPALAIGVLEQVNGKTAVRLSFVRSSNMWIPANKLVGLPAVTQWQQYFRDKSIGTLKTTLQVSEYPSNDNIYGLDHDSVAPEKIDEGKENFPYWLGYPDFRPLATATPEVKLNPIAITHTKIDEKNSNKIFKLFSTTNPTFPMCDKKTLSLNKIKKVDRKDVVFSEVFGSDRGARIVSIKVNAKLNNCDGPSHSSFLSHWYSLQVDGGIFFVDKSMYPIQILRESDGSDLWIFHSYGYNQDGYNLYSDNFSKSVVRFWKYH